MNDHFVKKDGYSNYINLNKEMFKYLLERLKQLGFKKLQIKTPRIILNTSNNNQNNPINMESKNLYSENEFLNLERDFKGLILSAINDKKEEIKILFINQSDAHLVFDDDVFTLVKNAQGPKLYVSTNDPIHTFGYVQFIKDFMEEHSQGKYLTYFLALLLIIIFTGIVLIIVTNVGPYKTYYLAGAVILTLPVLFFLPQKGVHLVVRKRNLPDAVTEVKRTWIVMLLTIIGTIVAQYLYSMFFHSQRLP